MLPLSVESKVEQYLKRKRTQPAACSAFSASSDWAIASLAAIERVLSATTTASTSSGVDALGGTPMVWMVRMPPLTSMPAMSVAPVKSSAMIPRMAMVDARVFPRELEENLTLRSGQQGRVSKGGNPHRACCPCFETLASLAPQHEVGGLRFRIQRKDSKSHARSDRRRRSADPSCSGAGRGCRRTAD